MADVCVSISQSDPSRVGYRRLVDTDALPPTWNAIGPEVRHIYEVCLHPFLVILYRHVYRVVKCEAAALSCRAVKNARCCDTPILRYLGASTASKCASGASNVRADSAAVW